MAAIAAIASGISINPMAQEHLPVAPWSGHRYASIAYKNMNLRGIRLQACSGNISLPPPPITKGVEGGMRVQSIPSSHTSTPSPIKHMVYDFVYHL